MIDNDRVHVRADSAVLDQEERIVWLDHPENFRYVRESMIYHSRRQTRPGRGHYPGRLVAYAVLRPDVRSEWPCATFLRRIWWVARHDPYEAGGCPCEAVDPCRVRAGRHSYYPVETVVQ
jgi:hypothetical protein